jgi:hypothetical protein
MEHPADEDELIHSLRIAQANLALREHINELEETFKADWEAFRKERLNGDATGLSPVSKLKLEAQARLALLGRFHCAMAHELIDAGDHAAAHSWALDEGLLNSSFLLLEQVDTSEI